MDAEERREDLQSESSIPRAFHAPPPLPARVEPPDGLAEIGGFSIAEIGTPAHPVSVEMPRSFLSHPGVKYLAMFTVGALLGGPIVGAAATRAGAGDTNAAHARPIVTNASVSHAPVPIVEGGPTCSEAEIAPEQLIELPQTTVARSEASLPARPKPAVASRGTFTARLPALAAGVPRKAFFEPEAALSALRHADVGSVQCGSEATGPTDVAVTFAPSGTATHVVIESGRSLGNESGSCIAARLEHVRIPSFDGTPETIRTRLVLD